VRRPVRAGHLDEAKLADVAGESGLRDLEAALLEQFAQLFLRIDPV
jgi:hypothetical protein